MSNSNTIMGFICVVLLFFIIGFCFGEFVGRTETSYEYETSRTYNLSYIWVDNNSEIDSEFIRLCYNFANTRSYIYETYDCKRYADDFSIVSLIFNYPVGVIAISNENNTVGHRLNYFRHKDGGITYIEPQSCKMLPDIVSVLQYHYNFTPSNVSEHSKVYI